MKRIAFVLFCLSAILLPVVQGQTKTVPNETQMGSYLVPKCKALLRSIDHEQAQQGDGAEGIYCLGFVAGFFAPR
jgi:hypothetical protein